MVFSNAQTSRSQIDQSRQVEADFSSASSASDMWDFTMKRKLQRAHVIQSMPFLAHGSFKSANVSCALNRTKHYEKDIAQADILDMAVMNLGVSPKIIVCSGRAGLIEPFLQRSGCYNHQNSEFQAEKNSANSFVHQEQRHKSQPISSQISHFRKFRAEAGTST